METDWETTEWFSPDMDPPHYTGWYECQYENSQAIVMRWYDAGTRMWYLDDCSYKQACFGWVGDRWRGLVAPQPDYEVMGQ